MVLLGYTGNRIRNDRIWPGFDMEYDHGQIEPGIPFAGGSVMSGLKVVVALDSLVASFG